VSPRVWSFRIAKAKVASLDGRGASNVYFLVYTSSIETSTFMVVTAKQLRLQTSAVLKKVQQGGASP
jgi:hypothetical protein